MTGIPLLIRWPGSSPSFRRQQAIGRAGAELGCRVRGHRQPVRPRAIPAAARAQNCKICATSNGPRSASAVANIRRSVWGYLGSGGYARSTEL